MPLCCCQTGQVNSSALIASIDEKHNNDGLWQPYAPYPRRDYEPSSPPDHPQLAACHGLASSSEAREVELMQENR